MSSPVFFTDRCLGDHHVPNALEGWGWTIERHAKHFAHDCFDEVWIPAVTAEGWVILTKDKRIRHRRGHLLTIVEAKASVFVLVTGQTTGVRNAGAFRSAHKGILQIISQHRPPLVATVTQAGALTVIDLAAVLP